MSCDICTNDGDNTLCDDCTNDLWEIAVGIGCKTGINACVMKLRKKSEPWATQAADYLEKCFREETR